MVLYTLTNAVQGLLYFGFEEGEMGGKGMSISSLPVSVTCTMRLWIFSTLFEVTEAVTLYVLASCTWPTRCTYVALEFKGPKSRLNLRIFGQ